jgi:acetyl-CoA/propionyl-CoA carboxylase carboxyl transferase subunit
MGASAAVEILHRKRLAAGLDRAADLGVLNAVIEPADTRRVPAAAIAAAPAERGEHGNIPL